MADLASNGQNGRRLGRYVEFIDAFSERIGLAVSWLAALLVIVICLNVALRYIGGRSWLALQDLSWYMFGAMFLLTAGYAFKHDRHVRVDLLYSRYSARTKAWIDLVGIVAVLTPFCLLGMWTSLDFVANSFRILEGSPDPGGLPARFIPKAFIPLGFLLLLVQASAEAGRRWLQLREDG